MVRRHLLPLAALTVLLGCGDYGDEVAPGGGSGDPMGPPSVTVSFAADVQPVFSTNCVGCHGDGGNAGLDLRAGLAHANLVGAPSTESGLDRVEPGEPELSWIYLKLTGRQTFGSSMPPGDPLPTDTTDLIRTWIEEGALDN